MSNGSHDAWVRDSERFEIGERLGVGGTGTVYEALDRERGQKVALKVLRTRDPQALYHFKREFRALADISHPHLVTIFELFAESDRWYFTLELVEGEHFSDYVRPPGEDDESGEEASEVDADSGRCGGRLDVGRLRGTLGQLAVGIKVLHEAGLLHCDLKPSNVLVTENGEVKILDFGLATELRPEEQSRGGGFAGTIAFTAPEQASGAAVSAATDWYSLGVILFQALTGRLPFEGAPYKIILTKIQGEAPTVRAALAEEGEELPVELVDLADLCDELLIRDPRRRPRGAEILRRLGVGDNELGQPARRAADSRLVGREPQLEALEDAYLVSLQRQAVAVYLQGPSGMGKTALAEYFLDQVAARGAAVLRGRCYEREMVPYKGLDGIVDSLSHYLATVGGDELPDLLPDDFPALLRLFPVLERALPRGRQVGPAEAAEFVTLDLVTLRRRGFAALRDLLAAIAERGPLVLFVDDLQWADADSIALLEELVRPPDPPPMVMLGAFRSEEVERQPFLRDLLGRGGSAGQRHVEVGHLDDEQAQALVRFLIPDEDDLPDVVMESLVREGQGTPFLLEQMARFVAIRRERLITGIRLAEMFEQRLRPLPDGARELLLTLTVANRPLDLSVARHAAGVTGDPQRLVAALRSASFVRSSGTAQRIELYHSRIGETLATLLDDFERQEIRRRLAAAYQACGLDDPQALYEHLLGAGDPAAAARQAILAGRAAFDALAFDRSAHFFRQALELDAEQGVGLGAEELRTLRRGLADSLANAGRSAEAGRLYLDLADAAHDECLALQCRAAEQYLMGGHVDAGLAVARTVLDTVGLRMPGGRKRALASLLFHRLRLRLRGLDFQHRTEAEIADQDLVRIDTCWAMATGLSMADNVRGADFQTLNLLLSLRAGEPYRVARALSMESAFLSSTGHLARAEQLLERARSLAEEVASDHALGLVRMQTGLLDYFSGRNWPRAVAAFDEAESIFRDRCHNVAWELTVCRRFGLAALMYQGELAELARRVPVYLAEARERGDSHLASTVRCRVNIVWLAADDPTEARRRVGESLATSEQRSRFSVDRYNALLAEVQADLYEDDAEAARRRLESASEALHRSMLRRIQLVSLETAYLEGRVALACAADGKGSAGESERLKAALREAERIERANSAWATPLACLLRAGVAARRRRIEDAVSLLERAVDGGERSSTGLHAAAARRRLGEVLGGDHGQELITRADRWMRRQRIVDPERMTAMLAPGF